MLFDIAAAAEFLRSLGAVSVTTWTVRSLVAASELPHIRLGKKIYLTKDSITNWLEKHERRNRS